MRDTIIRDMILFLLLSLLGGLASAQTNVSANDTIQLWVTVAEKTMVDIQPDDLGWVNVDPGTETNDSQLFGWSAKKPAIQIENIGSTNISYIWFNNSYPSSMPFGSGDPGRYDAGNFVVIKRNSTGGENNTYFFPNLVEYNESEIVYLVFPSTGNWAHGRFRSANREWFWAIDTSGGNCSNHIFKIGKDPHNQTQLGSVDLRTFDNTLKGTGANPCREENLTVTALSPYTGNNLWGYKDLYVGTNANYENYTVAVYWNCSSYVRAMFYKWNMDAPGAQETATHPKYFYDTTLKPGEFIIGNVKLRIPYGTAAGNITGALTVTVQAINVAG